MAAIPECVRGRLFIRTRTLGGMCLNCMHMCEESSGVWKSGNQGWGQACPGPRQRRRGPGPGLELKGLTDVGILCVNLGSASAIRCHLHDPGMLGWQRREGGWALRGEADPQFLG